MLTLNQGVGLLIAISLTVMFLMIGYQILQILMEVKKSVEKINSILDDANRVSDSVAEPVAALSEFVTGLKSGTKFLQALGIYKKATHHKKEA